MILEFLHNLANAIFYGFCLYNLVYMLIPKRIERISFLDINRWDRLACLAFSISGIIILLGELAVAYIYIRLVIEDSDFELNLLTTIFFFYFFFKSMLKLISSQFMWKAKYRSSRKFRLITALLLLLPIEFIHQVYLKLVIQPNYLPSSRVLHLPQNIIEYVITPLTFLFCVFLLYLSPLFKEKSVLE